MTVTVSKETELALKALKTNRFDRVEYAPDSASAVKLVLEIIPPAALVGIPGSTSVRQLGLPKLLKERGNRIIDVTAPSDLPADQVLRQTLSTDVILASSNALTLDGKLVNIDMMGNRIMAMVFGPKKVVLVIGTNKLVRDVDEAIKRIKNVIAPYHAATKGARTPCAVKGECTDCNSPDRICGITTIIERKPIMTEMNIIVVGEDLGLGWDPAWSKERQDRITAVYRETRRGFSGAAAGIPRAPKG